MALTQLSLHNTNRIPYNRAIINTMHTPLQPPLLLFLHLSSAFDTFPPSPTSLLSLSFYFLPSLFPSILLPLESSYLISILPSSFLPLSFHNLPSFFASSFPSSFRHSFFLSFLPSSLLPSLFLTVMFSNLFPPSFF